MVLAQNMCKIFSVPFLRERDEIFYTFFRAYGDISRDKVLLFFLIRPHLEARANKFEKNHLNVALFKLWIACSCKISTNHLKFP